MIDTHCHLTFPDFTGRIPEVLATARREGVLGAITISTTTQDCLTALEIADRYPNVWCTAGVHPLYADQGPHRWENLRRVGSNPRCVAWGELGLDNHYDRPARDVQRAVLDEQLAFLRGLAGSGLSKPIVLHCREAFDDLIPVLRASGFDPARMVFHCFTGTVDDARKALDLGAMISFTGVATYRNAEEVRLAAKLVPLDRIMVETDAPFLSPDPHRGVRPCEPWMSAVTARRLAEVRGERWEDFHAAIDRNTERFFGVAAGPARPSPEPAR
ncbi:MAG: TatD family hydrolase [Phycisphaerales bacterium]|nr:TatD family hydrolase [Phycisphaerales bacterium]